MTERKKLEIGPVTYNLLKLAEDGDEKVLKDFKAYCAKKELRQGTEIKKALAIYLMVREEVDAIEEAAIQDALKK